MTSDSTKIIPEALLKLKAALEEGKRDEGFEVRSSREGPKKPASFIEKEKKPDFKRPLRVKVNPDPFYKTSTYSSKTHTSHQPDQQKNEATPTLVVEQTQKTIISPRPTPLRHNVRVKAALAWLYETFPNVFKTANPLPLKIGITQDIAAWIDAQKSVLEQNVSETDNTKETSGVTSAEATGEVNSAEATGEVNSAEATGEVNSAEATGEANGTETTSAPTPFIPSKTAVRDAVAVYTRTLRYQKALLQNDKRYDLDGNEFGVVEEQQKIHADQRNSRIQAAIQAKAERRRMFNNTPKTPTEAQ